MATIGSSLIGEDFGADICIAPCAPHSLLFPRASAIVHHGGIGSAGQALLSGQPQLVTPVFANQFDNAERIRRLGAGIALPFRAWSVVSAKARTKSLPSRGGVARTAKALADRFLAKVETVDDMVAAFSDEDRCRRIFKALIWPDGRACPASGSMRSSALCDRSMGSQYRARPGLYQCLSNLHVRKSSKIEFPYSYPFRQGLSLKISRHTAQFLMRPA